MRDGSAPVAPRSVPVPRAEAPAAAIQAWLVSLAAHVRSWRYAESGKRDLRLDLLRGYCVFAMTVDHLDTPTWLYVLTGGNRFFVSAAEGFLFISGVSMGMVHQVTIQRKGVRAMFGKVLGRAWFLYALTVLLTIAFAAVSTTLGAPYAGTMTPS